MNKTLWILDQLIPFNYKNEVKQTSDAVKQRFNGAISYHLKTIHEGIVSNESQISVLEIPDLLKDIPEYTNEIAVNECNTTNLLLNALASKIKKNLIVLRIQDIVVASSFYIKQQMLSLQEDLLIKSDKIERLFKGLQTNYNAYMKERIDEIMKSLQQQFADFRTTVMFKFNDIQSQILSVVMGIEKIIQELNYYNLIAGINNEKFSIKPEIKK